MPTKRGSSLESARLELCWYEADPNDPEERGRYWAELVAGIDRIRFVVDEMEAAELLDDLEASLDRIGFQLDNYLVRTYELRERILSLLTAITNERKLVDKLRHRTKRKLAAKELHCLIPNLIDRFLPVQDIIEEDINFRNMQTHRQFVGLCLATDQTTFDPWNLITENPEHSELVQRVLRLEIHRFVGRYREKAQRLVKTVKAFLETAEPYTRF